MLPLRRRLGFLVGAVGVIAALVLLVAHAASRGRWPLGHPWVELAFVGAAVNLALHATRPDDVPADARRFQLAAALIVVPAVPLVAQALSI